MDSNGWISVDAVLPEVNVWVLFICTNNMRYVGRWRGDKSGWKSPFQGHVLYPPTHWMPLPDNPPAMKGMPGCND